MCILIHVNVFFIRHLRNTFAAQFETNMEQSLDKFIRNLIEKEVEKQMSLHMQEIQTATAELWKPVYTNQEVLNLLQVDPKTLKWYRDNGKLAFSQERSKFFYTAEDIKAFLSNGYHETF